jgi:tetratricopeptide (TPR) repeat protein
MRHRPGAEELSDDIVAEVTELCDRGDDDVEHGRYDEAIARYRAALAKIPAPVFAWKITGWILTALGDTHFFKKDYAAARDAINDAMRCIGAVGNPFLHLRLGQAELELGNRGRARDELWRAFKGAGEDLFAGEDPRYLAVVLEELRREQED